MQQQKQQDSLRSEEAFYTTITPTPTTKPKSIIKEEKFDSINYSKPGQQQGKPLYLNNTNANTNSASPRYFEKENIYCSIEPTTLTKNTSEGVVGVGIIRTINDDTSTFVSSLSKDDDETSFTPIEPPPPSSMAATAYFYYYYYHQHYLQNGNNEYNSSKRKDDKNNDEDDKKELKRGDIIASSSSYSFITNKKSRNSKQEQRQWQRYPLSSSLSCPNLSSWHACNKSFSLSTPFLSNNGKNNDKRNICNNTKRLLHRTQSCPAKIILSKTASSIDKKNKNNNNNKKAKTLLQHESDCKRRCRNDDDTISNKKNNTSHRAKEKELSFVRRKKKRSSSHSYSYDRGEQQNHNRNNSNTSNYSSSGTANNPNYDYKLLGNRKRRYIHRQKRPFVSSSSSNSSFIDNNNNNNVDSPKVMMGNDDNSNSNNRYHHYDGNERYRSIRVGNVVGVSFMSTPSAMTPITKKYNVDDQSNNTNNDNNGMAAARVAPSPSYNANNIKHNSSSEDTLNEELRANRALKSASIANEKLLVLTGASDGIACCQVRQRQKRSKAKRFKKDIQHILKQVTSPIRYLLPSKKKVKKKKRSNNGNNNVNNTSSSYAFNRSSGRLT